MEVITIMISASQSIFVVTFLYPCTYDFRMDVITIVISASQFIFVVTFLYPCTYDFGHWGHSSLTIIKFNKIQYTYTKIFNFNACFCGTMKPWFLEKCAAHVRHTPQIPWPPHSTPQNIDYIHTWTECTDNSAPQTLVSGQVASLRVLPVFCRKVVGIHLDLWARF